MRGLWVVVAMGLVGCASPAVVDGTAPHVAAHPTEPGAIRLSAATMPEIGHNPFSLRNPEGQARYVVGVLGPRCAGADITEESRIALAPALGAQRDLITFRVRCPRDRN